MTKSVFTGKYDRFRRLMIEARVSAGLTQAELAEKLLRPQSFVSKYERGERRLDVIEFLEISKVMGIDAVRLVEELNGGEPQDEGRR